jgi:hypothetical protein
MSGSLPTRPKLKLRPRPEPEPTPTPPPKAEPVETPVFDPERLAVQTYSAEGGQGFIQGKNYFSVSGKFIRQVPESQWYVTTPEMEHNNKVARARWRAMTTQKPRMAVNAPLPGRLEELSRERAQILAAETLSE